LLANCAFVGLIYLQDTNFILTGGAVSGLPPWLGYDKMLRDKPYQTEPNEGMLMTD